MLPQVQPATQYLLSAIKIQRRLRDISDGNKKKCEIQIIKGNGYFIFCQMGLQNGGVAKQSSCWVKPKNNYFGLSWVQVLGLSQLTLLAIPSDKLLCFGIHEGTFHHREHHSNGIHQMRKDGGNLHYDRHHLVRIDPKLRILLDHHFLSNSIFLPKMILNKSPIKGATSPLHLKAQSCGKNIGQMLKHFSLLNLAILLHK